MGLEQTFRKERPYRSNCVGHGQGGIMRYGAVPNQSLRYRFIGSGNRVLACPALSETVLPGRRPLSKVVSRVLFRPGLSLGVCRQNVGKSS